MTENNAPFPPERFCLSVKGGRIGSERMTDIGNPQERPTEWLPYKYELEYKLLISKQRTEQDEPKTALAHPSGIRFAFGEIGV